MKKTILLTVIILVFLTGILLTTDNNVNSNTIKSNNTTYVVKFHVIGCNSCTNVGYCIDGGQIYYVNSCTFTVDLTKGTHTICIHCPNSKVGFLTFEVTGSYLVQDVDVTVSSGGQECPCTDSKQ